MAGLIACAVRLDRNGFEVHMLEDIWILSLFFVCYHGKSREGKEF